MHKILGALKENANGCQLLWMFSSFIPVLKSGLYVELIRNKF